MAHQHIANRSLLALPFWLAALVAGLAACSRSADKPEVVLYSSVDDQLLRDVAGAFERESGVSVKIVGDTEATKTTGLVERLVEEKARPGADVWWSSEPLGTIRLAREGVLEAYRSADEDGIEGGWPREFRANDGTWYAFACRGRVVVYNTKKLGDAPPRTLAELTQARFKGRIGMARPQFGSTRGQMGALTAQFGEPALRAWLTALQANGLRLYDGNSAVVHAVAYGEIDAGLTDTDDVYAGQREGWPVDMVFAPARLGTSAEPDGPMLLPNTVALIHGAAHPRQARALIDFLLSERAERMLARSESRNFPVRPALAHDPAMRAPEGARAPDLERAADAVSRAMRACDEILR